MGFTLTVKENNTQVILDALNEKKETCLEALGMAAETYAVTNIENNPRRVDTGTLRDSISHDKDEDTAYIGTNVDYAIYVELGTRKMSPSHYLKRAVSEHIDEYRNVILAHMED